jgi:hypothetical protein
MIKKVISTVALLVFASAGPAHSQNGALFPVQQVGSDPTPSPPAGAAAAGFTTLAANYDWTGATTSFDPNHPLPAGVNLAVLSNWLYCTSNSTGASNPSWQTVGSATDCNAIEIANDGGTQVLDMQYLTADWPSNTANGLQTANSNNTVAYFTFPTGAYIEAEIRVPSTVQSGACPSVQPNCLMNDFFSWSTANSSNVPMVEWDFIEMYGQEANGGLAHAYFGASANLSNITEPGGKPGYDPTVYNIYGTRITTDGNGNAAMCQYLNNNILLPCGSGTMSPVPLPRDFLALSSGPQTSSYNFQINGHYYVQWIRVWECSGWATAQCNGTVLTGAP